MFKLLNDGQLEDLHDASLRILETCGVRIDDPSVRERLRRGGCRVQGERVFFERGLLDSVVAAAQNRIPFCGRDQEKSFVLEPGRIRTHSTGGAPWILDAKTGLRRNALSEDVIAALRLMNQLPELDMPCCLLYPSEAPAGASQYLQTESMFRYCHKPVYAPGVSDAGNAKYIVELFRLFDPGGGAYAGIVGIAPESPLYFPREITDVLTMVVEASVPAAILSAPMAGLTGPLTVAGCAAQSHAETLAFAALAYLIRPKTPLVFSYRPFFCNMKLAQAILGLPENGIASAICAQLAGRCGFLSDVYGLSCTSGAFDEQTGYEKMHNALLPALAGANLITGFGSLASVMCGSLVQLVIDNEIFAMVRRSLGAFAVDDAALGMEAIANVALEDSTFLVEAHTVENLRNPQTFVPRLGYDRTPEGDGSAQKTLLEKAQEEAAALLKRDEILPLSREEQAEMDRIRRAAEQELL